jgi:hypothetical protein
MPTAPQGPLQRLGANADRGQTTASQLARRDGEPGAQRTDPAGTPRHQPPHGLGYQRIAPDAVASPADQVFLEEAQHHVGGSSASDQLPEDGGFGTPDLVQAHSQVHQLGRRQAEHRTRRTGTEPHAHHGRARCEHVDRRTGQRPDQPGQRTNQALQLDAPGRHVALHVRVLAHPLDPHRANEVIERRHRQPLDVALRRRHRRTVTPRSESALPGRLHRR